MTYGQFNCTFITLRDIERANARALVYFKPYDLFWQRITSTCRNSTLYTGGWGALLDLHRRKPQAIANVNTWG